MPPRRRISNIAKLLPRKRASTPDPAPETIPPVVHRDCTSLPAGISALDDSLLGDGLGKDSREHQTGNHTFPIDDICDRSLFDAHDLRIHRFAQRYESNQLPRYRDYPPEEEEVSPCSSTNHEEACSSHALTHSSEESEPDFEKSCSPHCDLSSLQREISLLRENHALLSETTRETLRLAEALEARVEALQRGPRPSQRLFWILLDSLAAVVLFVFGLGLKPWLVVRKWFVAERVRQRRSWRLSVGDFENDPFLDDVAKRLSFSAVDD